MQVFPENNQKNKILNVIKLLQRFTSELIKTGDMLCVTNKKVRLDPDMLPHLYLPAKSLPVTLPRKFKRIPDLLVPADKKVQRMDTLENQQ